MKLGELLKCLYEIKTGFGGINDDTPVYFLDSEHGRVEVDDMTVGNGRICFTRSYEDEEDGAASQG